MTSERLDLVIFGATGFTGKHAVLELARGGKHYDGLTWGVAGRSKQKLETLMAEASKTTGKDLSKIKLIVADVSDEKSLKDMCAETKLVVNCAGPYRLYGEPVVRAAIDAKTHYVDVSGEPQFIETMQLRYDEAARDAGVYIISACGFDSIPNDMGVIFLQEAYANTTGVLHSVESYLDSYVAKEFANHKGGVINYGTWESLVRGVQHYSELGPLRKQMYPNRLPTFEPKLKSRGVLHRRHGRWCVPFLGADGSIVYRTQRALYDKGERPVQFKPYVQLYGLASTLLIAMAGLVIFLMAKTKFTRQLLLDYPQIFSGGYVTKESPSEEVTTNSYFSFTLAGRGWAKAEDVNAGPPNKDITAKVSGRNPGYGATVVALLHSGISILREQQQMPHTKGVMTTGVAFRNTTLIKRLNENNLKFEVIEDK